MGEPILIAGTLRSASADMVTWVRAPHEIVPGNAMPDMGFSQEQARDITAYLCPVD